MKKQIFSYWHQGFGQAPDLVQMCIRSLKANHQGWDVHLLDSGSVDEWLDPIPIRDSKWRKMPLAHQSDVIRTQLLIKYGGVWADPTIWFSRSMDDWLENVMESGLFLFHKPGRDRLISNWFIAATSSNILLSRLYARLCSYWSNYEFRTIGHTSRRFISNISRILNRNTRFPQVWLNPWLIRLLSHAPYMIYHYQFAALVTQDEASRRIWQETPKVSAQGPIRLQRYGLYSPSTRELLQLLDEGEPPLFKLTWKLGEDPVPRDSVLAELSRRAERLEARGLESGGDAGTDRCES